MLESITFSPMTTAMLSECADIAASAPDPWTIDGLKTNLSNLSCWNYVALRNGTPVAFACFLAVPESVDLQLIAVHPRYRRRGIAKALILHALQELMLFDISRCLLEVRKSNNAAIALYQDLGFKVLSNRPSMYNNPTEDGLLMGTSL